MSARCRVIGAQDEVVYLDFSARKVAALGLNIQSLIATLQNQNAVQPSGVVQAGPERISLRVSGQFMSEESLRAINLRVNDRFFPLSDVGTVTRGLPRSARSPVPGRWAARDRPWHRHEGVGQPAAVRRRPQGDDASSRGEPADRRRRPSRVRPAAHRRGSRWRLHRSAARSRGHRAGGELHQPRNPGLASWCPFRSRWCWPWCSSP